MFRERKGLTQLELAQKLNYSSESIISKIESGAAAVPAKKVTKFADALGVSVETLLGKDDDSAWTDNSTEILEQMKAMKEILSMLAEMDSTKLKQISKLIETFKE